MRAYKNILIYFFSFALLLGTAYNTYLDYDTQNSSDCKTYMSIANGEFKDQSLVRRYRIIVPFIAKAVALPFEQVYTQLWPHRGSTDWPLRMGFLLVNVGLMSLVGLVIFHCCKAYEISDTGSLLAVVAVLVGGRWGNLFAALPLTDSLYLLVLSVVVYALKTHNQLLLALCILIGPIAKESFLFVAPLIFFLSSLSKVKQTALFAFSGLLVFSIRYAIDQQAGTDMAASVATDSEHFYNIEITLKRLASVRGLGELCTVFGLFTLILLAGLTKGKKAITSWTSHTDSIIWWFIPVMLVHALLSTEAARMLYLGAAAWAVMIGLIWDKHPLMVKVKGWVTSEG